MSPMSPPNLIAKAKRAIESAELLNEAGDMIGTDDVSWLIQQAKAFVELINIDFLSNSE